MSSKAGKPQKISAFDGSYRRVAEAVVGYAEWRYLALLVALLSMMFLWSVAGLELRLGDESRVAGISRMMLETGDYLVPRLNGEPFLEYPPLYYWLQCVSFKVFGVSCFAAKFPSVAAAVTGCVLLYFLMRSMKYSPFTAFLSAMILGTAGQYVDNGLTGRVDILLAMFCIMAWCGFYAWGVKEQKKRRRRSFWVLVIGISGAVMTKNLAGLIILASGMAVFMVLDGFFSGKFKFERFFMLIAAFALGMVIPVGYCYFLYGSGGGRETIITMFVTNNFGRFFGSHGEHCAGAFYYLRRLPQLFQPWLLFLFVAVWFHAQRVVKKHSVNSLFALSVLVVPLLLLNLSANKRMIYLLPLAAPAAVLVGSMFGMFMEGKIVRFSVRVNDGIIKVCFYVIFLLGLLAPCLFAAAGVYLGVREWWRYAAAALMFLCTLQVWRLAKPRQEERVLIYLAVIFSLVYPNVAIPLAHLRNAESPRALFEYAEGAGGGVSLLSTSPDLPSVRESLAGAGCFYCGRDLPVVTSADAVKPGDVLVGRRKINLEDFEVKYFHDDYYAGVRK